MRKIRQKFEEYKKVNPPAPSWVGFVINVKKDTFEAVVHAWFRPRCFNRLRGSILLSCTTNRKEE